MHVIIILRVSTLESRQPLDLSHPNTLGPPIEQMASFTEQKFKYPLRAGQRASCGPSSR